MKHLKQFENWFDNKFGWFFTNGYKQIELNKKKQDGRT